MPFVKDPPPLQQIGFPKKPSGSDFAFAECEWVFTLTVML